jgi:AcrR family transcriptional regulator
MKDPERTKAAILKAAFQEVHRKGFHAASLGDILSRTALTKGALYHHFPNKDALGHALLDAIEQKIVERWLTPLQGKPDPVSALCEVISDAVNGLTVEEVELGCPLNNLAQEMSSLDEVFRIRVADVYSTWRDGIAAALADGQKRGTVAADIDPLNAAAFILASLAGCRGLAKNAKSSQLLRSCQRELTRYVQTLRG